MKQTLSYLFSYSKRSTILFRLFILFFLFSFLYINAAETQQAAKDNKQKICLNMIVKNEKDVIQRCLNSVKHVIDYWVILDTGSKDGTQKIIKNHMKDIPGELHERPWKNWATSRNEALQLAKGKGDYILFMDADDILEFNGPVEFPMLTSDQYTMWRGSKGFTYIKPQLVKDSLPWKWVGITHEYLDCEQAYTSELLETVKYVTCDDGASSHDTKKFLKNIALLEEGLKKEPTNSRYAFYLAESYRDAGDKSKALEWYQKRVNMGGWAEEVFWSKLQIAHMLHHLGLPPSILIESYLNAHQYRPHRAEPIYYLAELYNEQSQYRKAYEILKMYSFIPQPEEKDSLFNLDWIQEYGLLFQISICAYYVGNYEEAIEASDKLLANKNVPKIWHDQTKINRTFPVAKLKAKQEEVEKQLIADQTETSRKKNKG